MTANDETIREAVLETLRPALADPGRFVHRLRDSDGDQEALYIWQARAAFRALAEAGLLRQEMTEEWEPTRWWRATGPDGQLWCESSNEHEVRKSARPGDTIERLWRTEAWEWREGAR